jgi:hypothetical protein
MGPNLVDSAIRQAIAQCWFALPDERKNADAVKAETRRILERALRDFDEDAAAFGIK